MAEGVSVIVPVYNNASTLPALCERVRAALPDRTVEIILVDDGSRDHSLTIARTLDARIVPQSTNRGQHRAVLTGLREASLPIACVIDADLEDPPEGLPALIAALDTASVAFSSREERHTMTSRLFRWSIRRLFPTLPTHPCLCFAMDRDARAGVLRHAHDGDYLPAVVGVLRLATTQVRIARDPRPDAAGGALRGSMRWKYAAAMLMSSLRIRFTRAA